MPHGLAMRMRPPERDVRHAHAAGQCVCIGPSKLGRDARTVDPRRMPLLLMKEAHRDIDDAIGAFDPRCCIHAVDRRRRIADQFHRAPRADRLDRRTPSGHVTEQRRAHVAQCGGLRETRPPAGASAPCRERGRQRTKAQIERGFPVDFDVDVVRDEHRIGIEQLAFVEPDFADRRESVQAQLARTVRREPHAIPVVAVSERMRRKLIELARHPKRGRDRARHRRLDPSADADGIERGGRCERTRRRGHAFPAGGQLARHAVHEKSAASGVITRSYDASSPSRQSSQKSGRPRMRARTSRNCITIDSLAMCCASFERLSGMSKPRSRSQAGTSTATRSSRRADASR